MSTNFENADPKVLSEALETIGSRIQNGQSTGTGNQKLSKEDASVLYSLGYGLYQSGDLDQAETVFRKLVLAFPLEQKHWIGLAAVLQMQKQFKEALTSWSMACLLDDKDPMPHFHAAECLLSLKKPEEAIEALQASEDRLEGYEGAQDLLVKINALKKIWC